MSAWICHKHPPELTPFAKGLLTWNPRSVEPEGPALPIRVVEKFSAHVLMAIRMGSGVLLVLFQMKVLVSSLVQVFAADYTQALTVWVADWADWHFDQQIFSD